jgi:hypothetical protein
MPPVLKQDLGSLPDPFPVKPPRGHVLQQGDIGDYLLGMVTLASDGHTPHLLLWH